MIPFPIAETTNHIPTSQAPHLSEASFSWPDSEVCCQKAFTCLRLGFPWGCVQHEALSYLIHPPSTLSKDLTSTEQSLAPPVALQPGSW